jgi:imidazolonepropionase-like amidohydrolase
MRRWLRIVAWGLVAVLLLGFGAYWHWVRNPYADAPRLSAAELFAETPERQGLLIRGATLFDPRSGGLLADRDVVIRGDEIAAVRPVSDAPAPPGYLVIEAAGKYLIPGLIDLHVHLINTGGLAPPGAETTEAILDQMVRYGVTTALLTGGPAANDEQATELAKRQRAREIVAPLLFGAGDSFTVPGSHPVSTIMPELENATPEELHENGVAVITPDSDIRGLIGRKKRLGLFGVKILVEDGPAPWYPKPRMSLETARRIVDVAGKEGLPVLAHALSLDALRDAVEADVDAIMHSVNEPIPLGDPVIRRLREADTTYLTTLSVQFASVVIGEPERLEEPFLEAGVSPRALRSLANPLFRLYWSRVIGDLDPSVLLGHAMANVALLHDAGVRIALGSDSGGLPAAFPGHSAHVELALMVEAGLTPGEALRAATLHGAEFLGIEETVGTIEPGRVANLLLLDANPLDDIRNTRTLSMVVLAGRPIARPIE